MKMVLLDLTKTLLANTTNYYCCLEYGFSKIKVCATSRIGHVAWKRSYGTKPLPVLSAPIPRVQSASNPALRRMLWRTYASAQSVVPEVQSVILPGKERIRISPFVKDPEKLISHVESGCGTVYECVLHGQKLSADGRCLGTRSKTTGKYEWITYDEVIANSQRLGSALINNGFKPQNDTYIGINCDNRDEYVYTLIACSAYSMVICPLYDTYGKEALFYAMNLINVPVVILDQESKADLLLNNTKQVPSLKMIVLMDPITPALAKAATDKGIQLYQFDEFLEIGAKALKPPVPPKPDDLIGIMFTSGTTGSPKGVMITHSNAIATFYSMKVQQQPACFKATSTILSYLPVSHVYAMLSMISALYEGAKIGFYSGDVRKLLDDAKELRPTYFPLVPRLMNRIYQQVMATIEPRPLAKLMLKLAMQSKERQIRRGIVTNDSFWDKVILHKIQKTLGGNVDLMLCSSAPVSEEVIRFFKLTMGCYVFEAYGQTEIGAATETLPYDVRGGSVGPPIPSCLVKLVDVPELNYFAENDTGEICIKGPTVFKGYFKNPEATKESRDEDGWHHTGDIGKWLPDGTLKVIDRKKHILKTSQGEYLAPEKIESVYSYSPVVLQVFVDGFSDKDYLVAIVVPERAAFLQWLQKEGVKVDNIEQACNVKEARDVLLQHLHKVGKEQGLNSLEQVKALHLLSKPFSIEDGSLTPTQKLRREVVRTRYRNIMRDLYEQNESSKTR